MSFSKVLGFNCTFVTSFRASNILIPSLSFFFYPNMNSVFIILLWSLEVSLHGCPIISFFVSKCVKARIDFGLSDVFMSCWIRISLAEFGFSSRALVSYREPTFPSPNARIKPHVPGVYSCRENTQFQTEVDVWSDEMTGQISVDIFWSNF